jgi:hypothetical protein
MGYYIETPGNKNKAAQICEAYPEAKVIPQPDSFSQITPSVGLICIVDNGPFEAAAFCYNEREFEEFTREDGRDKVWIVMSREKAEKLSGYNKK